MVKKVYILDECCLHHASKLVDHDNNFTSLALKVFTDIEFYCSSILVSKGLLKKYHKHINQIDSNPQYNSYLITTFLYKILPNQRKFRIWDYEIQPLIDEKDLPSDDIDLIRLAHASKATLVTSDMRLIEKLNPDKSGYSSRYNLRVLKLDQVVEEVRQNNTT